MVSGSSVRRRNPRECEAACRPRWCLTAAGCAQPPLIRVGQDGTCHPLVLGREFAGLAAALGPGAPGALLGQPVAWGAGAEVRVADIALAAGRPRQIKTLPGPAATAGCPAAHTGRLQ